MPNADVQIMVYLGILVTRKIFSWQKISRIFAAHCQNWKIVLEFHLYLANFL